MELAGDQGKQPSNVRRLQPLRVLLAGRDRRFLRVTSFLLSRRGYEVKRSTLADAPGTSDRERADVVLLDLDGSRVDAGRIVAALQASAGMPALLLLTAGADDGWKGLSALPKWTPIEALAAEIERAALHRPRPAVPRVAEGDQTSL